MSQYFLHLSLASAAARRDIARRAGAALDVLQPGCRRIPWDGPAYAGWVAQDRACRRVPTFTRSADGAFDMVAEGAWFLHGADAVTADALLARLMRDGIDATASRLEGAFAIVLCDRRHRAVHVITDIAGTLHVFAARHGAGWIISTSSAWLAAMGSGDLDPVAAREFVAAGIVYEDRTLWQGVRKLGQARIVTFAPDATSTERRYWSFAAITPERDDLGTSVERLADGLATAAKAIGRRYPRVLCDITGGYDSRATIAGFVSASVPFAGTVSGPEESADVRVSRAIAQRLGIAHGRASPERVDLDDAVALSDGEIECVEYARIAAIHREHARLHDVSVNGCFGELARGYWWELLWPSIGVADALDGAMLARRRFGGERCDPGIFAEAARFDYVSHVAGAIARANAPLEGMPNTTLVDHAYFALRMHRWQGRIASSTARIWPTVSPFAFRSVLEPVLEARAASRTRSLLIRTLLARVAPALADIALEGGYPAVPATLANLRRFWPVVPHYAGRIRMRVARSNGARGGAAAATEPARESSGAFVSLLASGAFAPDRLRRCLAEGPRDAQYARLATIARGLRQVVAARAAAFAGPRGAAQDVSCTGAPDLAGADADA